MGAMTNLLVKDDAATPTELTFVAISDNPEPFWRGSVTGVSIEGQARFTASATQQKNGGYKVTAKLEVPVMETLGASGTSSGYVAPPKVAYVTTCIFSMFVDKRATDVDRANAFKLMVGMLQGASATTATGILSNTAAGSAFVNSALPITQLFTKLVQPN